MSEWQPIETAPKWEPILCFGLWAGEINGVEKHPGIYIAMWAGGKTDYPGFEWSVTGTDAYAAWCKPTHWMPLPDLPKIS